MPTENNDTAAQPVQPTHTANRVGAIMDLWSSLSEVERRIVMRRMGVVPEEDVEALYVELNGG